MSAPTTTELIASLRSCSHLLNVACNFNFSDEGRATAAKAVVEAQALLKQYEQQAAIPTGEATDSNFGEFLAAQGAKA
jgi:hypothetical protein